MYYFRAWTPLRAVVAALRGTRCSGVTAAIAAATFPLAIIHRGKAITITGIEVEHKLCGGRAVPRSITIAGVAPDGTEFSEKHPIELVRTVWARCGRAERNNGTCHAS